MKKRKVRKIFPLDFYGEDGSWRFIIRAEQPEEIIDAMYWRAYISCHRKDFDLLHMACDKFNYKYNYSSSDSSEIHYGLGGTPLRVNMMGPIVLMATIRDKVINVTADSTDITAQAVA
ncbi:hypothetical protein [Photobacterium sp. GB-56]|uniref:hypothetical protein n=1 Tax=Photobacterium sp. GB-56 TaxID=2022106 RepID=UPI000D184B06|nr:hypothetical protein [Photobacterium sp. GB-56]PSV26145.1 hypothetical protein C9J42_12610 [Photobacterium sp. GB-56]